MPEVATTWVGFVGPGVRQLGETGSVWSDHTDHRPTILLLTGLSDDYVSDGRVLTEFLEEGALPKSLKQHQGKLRQLAEVYKEITAPFGEFFGPAGIDASTTALEGDDATYQEIEGALMDLTVDRDAVAIQMRDLLDAAAFHGQAIKVKDALELIGMGMDLIGRADALAGSP